MDRSARLLFCSLFALPFSVAAMGEAQHSMEGHAMHDRSGGEHAVHEQLLTQRDYRRSEHRYTIPDVTLTDSDGRTVTLQERLAGDKPVMLNFIYTTCTTICPVLSATFAEVQQQLGNQMGNVQLVSVTIDPEYDTPEQLKRYAEALDASDHWTFLTGGYDDIVSLQKAFDIYRGSKSNHVPAAFVRTAADRPWVRLEGFASAGELVDEYHRLMMP